MGFLTMTELAKLRRVCEWSRLSRSTERYAAFCKIFDIYRYSWRGGRDLWESLWRSGGQKVSYLYCGLCGQVLIVLFNLFTDSSSFVRSLSSLLWRSILYRANISTVASIIGCMINLLKPVAEAYYNSYGQCPANVTSLANDMGSTISRLLQDSLEESSHIFENILEGRCSTFQSWIHSSWKLLESFYVNRLAENRDPKGRMQFAALGVLLSNGLFEFEDGAQIQGTSSIIATSVQLFKSAVCQISKILEELRLEVGLDDAIQVNGANIARSFGELWSASDFVAFFLRSNFLKRCV